MKISKKLFYAASSTIVSIGMMMSSTANASVSSSAGYTPCHQLKNELTGKVMRLRQMAQERESYGDAYGARRLRNTANIITAHIGNLPCVGRQTCLCD